MNKFGMLVAALVLALPLTAKAHGPTRQKVTETVTIAAPADKVWAVVKEFGKMEAWHPAVEKSETTGGNAPGTIRIMTLKGGAKLTEKLESYSDTGMSFKYTITDVSIDVLPVSNYSATITVKAVDAGNSSVEWRGAFYRGYQNNDPPPQYNDEAAVTAVTGIYKTGLANLKAIVEKK